MSETKFEALVELSREAEDNATSRGLRRIHFSAGAGGWIPSRGIDFTEGEISLTYSLFVTKLKLY